MLNSAMLNRTMGSLNLFAIGVKIQKIGTQNGQFARFKRF